MPTVALLLFVALVLVSATAMSGGALAIATIEEAGPAVRRVLAATILSFMVTADMVGLVAIAVFWGKQ